MVVSRFFENPILNNFSEIQKLHQNTLSRDLDPDEVAGYMRKQEFERMKASSPTRSSKVKPLAGVTKRKLMGSVVC
jgi:hypothetical protein